ncbi:MAG TPA: hypothetical protein VFS97_14310 [Nitrososphaeraceae archaeon]|nr:hypothetical protein [Nitrososphaeraceae archaeon]
MNLSLSLFTTTTKNHPVAIITVIAIIITMSVQNSLHVGYAQTMAVKEKKDVFKVIVTLFGVEPTTGNIVTFVTIDNMSNVKAFDAAKYYIPIDTTESSNHTINATYGSSNSIEGTGIVELNLAFPNATSIKSGDEYRACSIVLKDLRMACETGVNTPALRAENVDMHLDTAQFLKVEDMEGKMITEDNIGAVEEVVDAEEEEDVASDKADEEEEG